MKLLDKYIIYTSIFALFTETIFFNFVIDLKLSYFILITNFLLLSVNKRLTIHKYFIYLLAFFLLHGVVNYYLLNHSIQSLLSQIIGISISSIFYNNLMNKYTAKKLFSVYLDISYYLAILSFFIFLYLSTNYGFDLRLKGIMAEPSHYCLIMFPATYFFLRNKNYKRFLVLVLTLLLAKSSLGFFGLILICATPLLKVRFSLRYSWITFLLIGLSALYIIDVSKDEKKAANHFLLSRTTSLNDNVNSIYSANFQANTNLSSYVLLSHIFVSRNIFLNHPFGIGLGAYGLEYENYFPEISPPKYVVELDHSKLNKQDANSLFLRLTADLGVFAFILLLYFVIRTFSVFKNNDVIAQSMVFYLILKLIREGHYFPPEFHFFLLIFLKNHNEDIARS